MWNISMFLFLSFWISPLKGIMDKVIPKDVLINYNNMTDDAFLQQYFNASQQSDPRIRFDQIAKPVKCGPYPYPVSLIPESEKGLNLYHYPEITMVHRCMGNSRSAAYKCGPTQSRIIMFSYLVFEFKNEKLEYKQTDRTYLYNHTACGPLCKLSETGCPSVLHQVDEVSCSCYCFNYNTKSACLSRADSYFDDSTCTCISKIKSN